MAQDMSKERDKIVSNGFSTRELLSLRWIYRELKKVYHPELTRELTFEKVIAEEARKSFSLTKYYLLAFVFFSLTALFFERPDFLFMPAAFLLLAVSDIRSSAKNRKRTMACELKLMKLAFRMRL